MVATGTLRMMDGAELGGLEMTEDIAGSPTVVGSIASPDGRSGAFHYRCAGAATHAEVRIPAGFTSGGSPLSSVDGITDAHLLYGYGFRSSDLSPAANRNIGEFQDEGDVRLVSVTLQTNGDLAFFDAANTLLQDEANPLTVDGWSYIEIAFQHVASSGAWEIWLDGVSLNSGSAGDFEGGVSDEPWVVQFEGPSSGDGNYDFDDLYVVSHTSTLQGNNLGPSEVFAYQGQAANATADDGGTNLDISNDANDFWADNGQAPITSATWSGYGASGVQGATFFDTAAVSNAGHGRGPTSGGPTVDGAIQGAMWLGVYQRGTGGGTTHRLRHGNSADTMANLDMDAIANSSDSLRAIVSESATLVPLATEDFAMGAGTTGAQDIEIREQFAFLLHTPAAFDEAELAGLWTKGEQDPVRDRPEMVAY